MSAVKNVEATVKFFTAKGYGFLTLDSGEDVFFHWSQLNIDGYKTVDQGQRVLVGEVVTTERGAQALDITPLASELDVE